MHRGSNPCAEKVLTEVQDFFNDVIFKGQGLGKVAHYFYQKEYQARGAPHYHVILWIESAPVAGKDDDDVLMQWIQEMIISHITKEASNQQAGHQVLVPQVQQVLQESEEHLHHSL